MSFGQLLTILRARRWVALLVFTLTVAGTMIVSLLLPKQYTGAASVVIDVKPDPVSAMGYSAAMLPGFIATQVDILSSDRVALRVIRDLKLLDSAPIRQQWLDDTGGKGSIEQWLVGLLQRRLDVKPSRESNVIGIHYRAPDARFAAALANAFAQAYIATTLELRVDPARQFATFFDGQSRDARDALERAQGRLSAFQREKGIIASDERLDVENARLNELSSQLVQTQALAGEASSRQAHAQGAAADKMQEVLTSPLVSGLRTDLTRAEARLQELGAKYGDAHPQVVETKASIAELRRRIDGEIGRISSGVGVTNAITRQREGQVRAALEAQRAKVLQMKAVRDEGQVLVREVEGAQRAYDGVMARLNQVALEAQSTQSYAHVLTEARPAAEPSSPKLLLHALASVFVGTALATGAALVLEHTDRRVRASDDVVAALDLPVLGTLPRPLTRLSGAARHAQLMQQRVVGLRAPASTRSG